MDQNREILDHQNDEADGFRSEEFLISENKFMFFCFVTFGMYQVWWIYKAWRFFQQKDKLDILPAARALFSLFFLHGLFVRISNYASSKGYATEFSITGNYFGYVFISLLGSLPQPYWLIGLMNFVFLIPAFRAFNYAKQNSSDIIAVEQVSLSYRQIAMVAIGGIFWYLVILGMFYTNPDLRNY